jgi:NADP-dependent 3-hydroxy acid dehydrogenase YdfG
LAVLKGMRARGEGTVINVASFAGWHFSELTGPAYTASKAGMMALTHSFNIEQGAHGLRATALCPGEVATPILKKRPVEPSAAEKARMLQEEDLGHTIRFIAELPAHVCINELVITPVWNRIYLGGEDLKRR